MPFMYEFEKAIFWINCIVTAINCKDYVHNYLRIFPLIRLHASKRNEMFLHSVISAGLQNCIFPFKMNETW